jgi:hypothetical protein
VYCMVIRVIPTVPRRRPISVAPGPAAGAAPDSQSRFSSLGGPGLPRPVVGALSWPLLAPAAAVTVTVLRSESLTWTQSRQVTVPATSLTVAESGLRPGSGGHSRTTTSDCDSVVLFIEVGLRRARGLRRTYSVAAE